MHNKNVDEICWCEVCEDYRQNYYAAKVDDTIHGGIARRVNYFLLGLLVVSLIINVAQHFAIMAL